MLKSSMTGSVAALALMLPLFALAAPKPVSALQRNQFILQENQSHKPSLFLNKADAQQDSEVQIQKAVNTRSARGLYVNHTPATSEYGNRLHPVSKRYKLHQGDDYAAPAGTPIMAPSAGIITYMGRKNGYGNTVMLRHSSGQETLYAHMSRFNKGLKVGDVVQNGDKIGYVGSTGISTGPHLHFEVWVDGKRVRPSSVKLPSKALNASEAELLRTYLKPTGKPAKTIQL